MKKIKYKIKEVKPGIFLAEFKDSYDMCMTFCRYQEYYESPNPNFRNKPFNFFDFVKWYSQKYGNGNFTYTNDWSGFNIPSNKLLDCFNSIDISWDSPCNDHNQYDETMSDIINAIRLKMLNKPIGKLENYYLIGAMDGNERTIRHEVAHGMFYLNKEYKKEMLTLVKALKPTFRKKFYQDLEKIGYTKQVLPDEAQAFLATGWKDYFTPLKGEDAPFIKVFNKYYESK
jgi:hypothetical protein